MIKLMFKINFREIKLLDISEFCFRLDDKAFLRKKKKSQNIFLNICKSGYVHIPFKGSAK